jgi:hypothetical protein
MLSFFKFKKGKKPQLYINIQSVPRSKHTQSLLYKPVSYCCIWKMLLCVLRSTQNT